MTDTTRRPPNSPEPDLGLAFGTVEEGRAAVGNRTAPRGAISPVSRRMTTMFCALIEDGNPNYWERDVMPPSLFAPLDFRYPWHPDPTVDLKSSRSFRDVPLPGKYIINVETDTEYFAPAHVGDEVTVEAEVKDVSPTKLTALGEGNFIYTVTTFRNGDGVLLARHTNVLLRYTPEGER